jgi:hypothetical protein
MHACIYIHIIYVCLMSLSACRPSSLQELIDAKMKAASAALEEDSRHASCNSQGQQDDGSFLKHTFLNSTYNDKVEADLVQQLIEAKLQAASAALESDERGRRLGGLKRLVRVYAERVASLEVAAARGITAPPPPPSGGDLAITITAGSNGNSNSNSNSNSSGGGCGGVGGGIGGSKREGGNTSIAVSSSSSSPSSSSSSSPSALLLCGSLFRRSTASLFSPVSRWERKYFELSARKIHYYEDESE